MTEQLAIPLHLSHQFAIITVRCCQLILQLLKTKCCCGPLWPIYKSFTSTRVDVGPLMRFSDDSFLYIPIHIIFVYFSCNICNTKGQRGCIPIWSLTTAVPKTITYPQRTRLPLPIKKFQDTWSHSHPLWRGLIAEPSHSPWQSAMSCKLISINCDFDERCWWKLDRSCPFKWQNT